MQGLEKPSDNEKESRPGESLARVGAFPVVVVVTETMIALGGGGLYGDYDYDYDYDKDKGNDIVRFRYS